MCNLAGPHGQRRKPGTGHQPRSAARTTSRARATSAACRSTTPATRSSTTRKVRALFEEITGHAAPVSVKGWKLPGDGDAALEGKLKGAWIIGYDVAQTDPNTEQGPRGPLGSSTSSSCTTSSSTRPQSTSHLVLPARASVEKDGTFTNGERRIQRVRKVVDPPPGVKSDWEAICEVATAMGTPDVNTTTRRRSWTRSRARRRRWRA